MQLLLITHKWVLRVFLVFACHFCFLLGCLFFCAFIISYLPTLLVYIQLAEMITEVKAQIKAEKEKMTG